MLNNWTEFVPAVKKAFGALGKQHPKMLAAYGALEEASAEGALDAKTRELISIAVAITTRCDGCIGVHTEAALKAGASEALAVDQDAVAVGNQCVDGVGHGLPRCGRWRRAPEWERGILTPVRGGKGNRERENAGPCGPAGRNQAMPFGFWPYWFWPASLSLASR